VGSGRGRGGGRMRGMRGGGRGRAAGRGTTLPISFTPRDRGGSRYELGKLGDGSYEFEHKSRNDRFKYDEEAGDSDVSNEVNDSEDEEIDEDEAFDSDDERKYGELLGAITRRRKGLDRGGDSLEGDSSDEDLDVYDSEAG
ncbi:unnamed protein product, partial [Discosporangium mesarthrocarpum]